MNAAETDVDWTAEWKTVKEKASDLWEPKGGGRVSIITVPLSDLREEWFQ